MAKYVLAPDSFKGTLTSEEVSEILAEEIRKKKPDAAIVIETTTAADLQGTDETKQVCVLGKGPAISFMDRGTVYDTQLFRELYDSLVYGVEGQRPDVYYVLADFDAYVQAQEKIAALYSDKKKWAKMAILNIANSGKFSSDRTIEDYVRDIWKLEKMHIK